MHRQKSWISKTLRIHVYGDHSPRFVRLVKFSSNNVGVVFSCFFSFTTLFHRNTVFNNLSLTPESTLNSNKKPNNKKINNYIYGDRRSLLELRGTLEPGKCRQFLTVPVLDAQAIGPPWDGWHWGMSERFPSETGEPRGQHHEAGCGMLPDPSPGKHNAVQRPFTPGRDS